MLGNEPKQKSFEIRKRNEKKCKIQNGGIIAQKSR